MSSYAASPRMPRRQNPQKPVIGMPSMESRKLARRHLMALGIAIRKHPLAVLLGLMAASLAILPLLPPIPQDPNYHQFADQRSLLGIPNFWNVVSNLPFVLVGAIGLWQFGRDRASFVLFLGVFL